jgi:hypothetical protein
MKQTVWWNFLQSTSCCETDLILFAFLSATQSFAERTLIPSLTITQPTVITLDKYSKQHDRMLATSIPCSSQDSRPADSLLAFDIGQPSPFPASFPVSSILHSKTQLFHIDPAHCSSVLLLIAHSNPQDKVDNHGRKQRKRKHRRA